MEIIITIILAIATVIYLKMYNSHPFFLLDKNGVVKQEFKTKFSLSYITINPKDFGNFEKIHSKYFPNGTCRILKSSLMSQNSLFIEITLKDENSLPITFIVRKIKESPDTYYMYLSENYFIDNRQCLLKGELFKGSISILEQCFESWEKKLISTYTYKTKLKL